MSPRDGHVRVLPLHVANKIAAGEVVERPASVVKELVENAIDSGATQIKVTVVQGGRKLVAVQDDGCGMTRDDAVLALERQATSKIRDVTDIEEIDTLGFRGEAIPSIASVSRFTITTRRHDADEGTLVQVNAGTLAEVRAAGCPPGTLVEVRDLFCNVPARRKFLRAYATEENHVKNIFAVHALAHPSVAFTLVVDGAERYRLAAAANLSDRVRDLFGDDFLSSMLPLKSPNQQPTANNQITITGYIERPNLNTPTRRDQFVFVNGRPASAPSVAYALREGYPRRQGDAKPAAIVFIDLPPNQVDVNVHPTKREVRFRDNVAVREAIISTLESTISAPQSTTSHSSLLTPHLPIDTDGRVRAHPALSSLRDSLRSGDMREPQPTPPTAIQPTSLSPNNHPNQQLTTNLQPPTAPAPAPVQVEFAVDPDSTESRPWQWFKYLAQTASGYLMVETDAGVVTINPHAARERIAYERLLDSASAVSQDLLIPETVRLTPVESARLQAALPVVTAMGFAIEPFGSDTWKIDAVPQLIGSMPSAAILATIARDLGEGGTRRGGERWREEIVAKSVARSFAGAKLALTEEGAVKLVEELCSCKMPYICPRGKPVMIFTSTRELDRKFARN